MSHVRPKLAKSWSPTLLLPLLLCQPSCGAIEDAPDPEQNRLHSQPQALVLDKPVITDVQGAVCPIRGGCEVTLIGRRFNPAFTKVRIGGTQATPCRVATSTRMVCTVPPGAAGQVALTVENSLGGAGKSATWPEKFFYLDNELPLWPLHTLSLPAVPKASAVADLNGDGYQDIAIIFHGRDGVQVFLGQPGGRTWSPPLDFATGRQPSAIAAADFDGDGSHTSDLIITNEMDNSFTRLVGVKATPTVPYAPLSSTISTLSSHSCVGPKQIIAQDLNLDGGPDLVINCDVGSPPSMMAFTNARGSFGTLVHTDTAYTLNGATRVFPAHANRDLISDMLIWRPTAGERYPLTEYGRDGYLLRYNNDSHYAVTALGTTPLSSIGSGDFNRDSMIDFIGLTDTKKLWVIAASTTIDWFPSASVKAQLPTREAYQRLLSIDMNKDGHLDIVAFQPPVGALATADIFLGDGAFGFSPATPVSLGFAADTTDFADVDGDGYPDLLLLGADTPFSGHDDDGKTLQVVFSQKGTIPSLASISEVGNATIALLAHDVNGDKILDLAVLNYSPGELRTLIGNSAGEFEPATPKRIHRFTDTTGSIVADAMDINSYSGLLGVLHTAQNDSKQADAVTLLEPNPVDGSFENKATFALRAAGAGRIFNYSGIAVGGFTGMSRMQSNVLLSRRTVMGEDGSLDAWFKVMVNWQRDMVSRDTKSKDPSAVHLFSLDGVGMQAVTLSSADRKLSILSKLDGAPSYTYSTGPSPSAVASCDLDGDMRADLVVASADSDLIQVFADPLNGGAPPRVDVPVCAQPSFVFCGDLNGDQHADLLVGCDGLGSPGTATMEVLYGGSNRRFYRGGEAAPRPGRGGPIAVLNDAVAGLRIATASVDGVLWTILPGR